MKLSGREKIIQCCIVLAVSIFCFYDLSLKPPHVDESVNGFFVNTLWEKGFYTYDPNNYHGPLLFYLFQISEKIFGFGIEAFRIVSVLFLILTIFIILKSRTVLDRHASIFVALALGLSPGMIFFSRSAIHESAFVFFQVVWMIGFLKLREQLDQKGLLWFIIGLLGCALLKETFVILGLAFFLSWGWIEFSPHVLRLINKNVLLPHKPCPNDISKVMLFKIGITVLFVWLILITGFFHNGKGITDFFVALIPWLETGVGSSGHDKPFYYWVALLWRYEWVSTLGVILSLVGLFHESWKIRFFSALALTNGIIYSFIPYKTPWCIMSILWPFVIVTGLLFEYICIANRSRYFSVAILLLVLLAIGIGHSAVVGYRLNFKNYTNSAEPYVYVQTKEDVTVIEDIIREKIQISPNVQNMTVWISLKDPWPLPWIFSRFPHVMYGDYRKARMPKIRPDLIFNESFVDDSYIADLYWWLRMELREARGPIIVYFKKSLFRKSDLSGLKYIHADGIKGE